MAIDPTQFSPQFASVSPEANGVISPLVSGNYVSPEQAQAMRLYAAALSKNAMTMPVRNGWQGLAQMANSVMGGLAGRYADQQQRDITNEGISAGRAPLSPLESLNGGSPQVTPSGNSPGTSSSYAPINYSGDMSDNSVASHDAFNQAYAKSIGIDPQYVHNLTAAEGLYAKSPNRASYVDKDKDGTPFSFGDFQMNVHPGALGDAARKAGIDPSDPTQWQQANMFAMNWMRDHDASPWRTDKAVEGYRASNGIQDYSVPRITPTGAPPTQVAQTTAPNDPMGSPTAAAYAPDTNSGALAAINASAPPSPSGLNLQNNVGTRGPQADPYMQAALRNQYFNPAMLSRVLNDPTVSPTVQNMVKDLYSPQMVEGPFGTKFITSTAGALTGATPRMFSNMGQVQNFEAGKLKLPIYTRVNPDGSTVSRIPLGSGGTFSLNGSAPPAPSQPGSPPPPTPTQPGTPPPPTPTQPGQGGYVPPLPTNGSANDMINWDIQREAGEEAAKKDVEHASTDIDISRKNVPAIQGLMNNLNQVRGYIGALSQTTDPNSVFGPLEPETENVMGVLNQLHMTGKNMKDTLGNLNAISKGLAQTVATQAQALEGNNGKALAAGIELATQASPNLTRSYQGILKTMDSLQKVMEYRQNYELAKQNWYQNHQHNLNGFDQEWTKGIQGGQSEIPEAKPFVLTKTPISKEPHTFSDGIPRVKVPSTDKNGYRWVPASEVE